LDLQQCCAICLLLLLLHHIATVPVVGLACKVVGITCLLLLLLQVWQECH
jgi:hypothetical protein